MIDADALLARLREAGPEGATARLAALVVDDVLGRPLSALVDPRGITAALRDALRAFTSSDAAAAHVVAWLAAAETAAANEKGTLGSRIPEPLQRGARDLVALPSFPPRDVVAKLLDHEPLRRLLRAQVIDTLVAFGRRAASPVADSPLARGLGGLSKLALGQGTKPSKLGAIANAVSGEVERQVEKRAADFADTAVEGILGGIASQVSDPAHAGEQASVRLALLGGLFELTFAEAAQLARGPLAERVEVARAALSAWASAESFSADVEALVAGALAAGGERSLGELLSDMGLREVAAARGREAVAHRLASLLAGAPFAQWLRGVVVE